MFIVDMTGLGTQRAWLGPAALAATVILGLLALCGCDGSTAGPDDDPQTIFLLRANGMLCLSFPCFEIDAVRLKPPGETELGRRSPLPGNELG